MYNKRGASGRDMCPPPSSFGSLVRFVIPFPLHLELIWRRGSESRPKHSIGRCDWREVYRATGLFTGQGRVYRTSDVEHKLHTWRAVGREGETKWACRPLFQDLFSIAARQSQELDQGSNKISG